jgi:hypothetical protein
LRKSGNRRHRKSTFTAEDLQNLFIEDGDYMKYWTEQLKRLANPQWLVLALLVLFAPSILAQETTGGLQGTVKDPSGAVVPSAQVVVTGSSLVGSKQVVTDSSGYYRFSNLPPGSYTITVKAEGFDTLKRQGLALQVGHLPTVDLELKVGEVKTVVEVNTEGALIDTTSTTTLTNIAEATLANTPHGITFQSVIQFAPMARNEPLAGMSTNGQGAGGTGGSLPGSSGNGLSFGYSIGGAADSESSYLVEGQDTENISGGYSKANVPMDFIQEVEMKTSGISAEYGGALGGVVNVIMKKGGNDFHGAVFSTYESSGTDGNQVNAFLRYDPTDSGNSDPTAGPVLDPTPQIYQPKKDHFRTTQPGVTVGGPILKDRIWFFAGFNPLYNDVARTVDFGTADNAGKQYFTQDKQTYYGTARVDAAVTNKIRVFGSWLYQGSRETGDNLPIGDPINLQSTFLNSSTTDPLTSFSHGLGWSAPNATYNVGADITVTQNLVSTTRYGYFFENYHDFGWPTTVPNLVWSYSDSGKSDNLGNPLPANLQIYNGAAATSGTSTTPFLSSYTLFNSDKHYQFNQDFAYFKSGWWGTHNLKVGYQLNHLVNVISQNGNVPQAFMHAGSGHHYTPATTFGAANCASLKSDPWGTCAGQYGYLTVLDFATILTTPASDWNHALYAQDSWTIGNKLTLDLGIRVERETLPAPAGFTVPGIDFPWSDKIEPRLGVAWNPTGTGKIKVFGSYGVVNDVMKLLLAQTSFGAQAYEECIYAFGPDGGAAGFNTSDIDLAYNKNGRACPSGAATLGANFANGKTPASLVDKGSGVSLIENVNYRPWEPVSPDVKPYRQHEFVAGFDYQLSPNLAFEARYDRRRLDHVIEDASLADPANFELYTIVNPGEGVNKTIDSYANYLTSIGDAYGEPNVTFNGPGDSFGTCPSCPANPKAVRNYDGLELRLSMNPVHRVAGMVSYTYSKLWGNYTGLTTTDQSDGGTTGRNSPDTTRSFDEPFYYFGANGKSNNGHLPTDRPNVLKGYAYYALPWWKVGSYIDLAYGGTSPVEATYVFGRDKWAPLTSAVDGTITIGTPYARRTPWYLQSDLNAKDEIKTGDHESVSFEATALNVLNQRSVVAYNQAMNSWNFATPLFPGSADFSSGAALYQELEGGYNVQQWINPSGVIQNSQYGKPYLHQNARTIHLAVRFNF